MARSGLESSYAVRTGAVDFVTVPEFGYVVVDGRHAPDGPDFSAAIQALYSVSYGAHFLVKNQRGEAPPVHPLEALWWADEPGRFPATDPDRWRWQALIMQPSPIDEETVAVAVEQAKKKTALDGLRYVRWAEGYCAQLLHIGPYAEEAPSVERLHKSIAEAGCRPVGRHHEIYLGDPRRSAPERLRTILRQPVETA